MSIRWREYKFFIIVLISMMGLCLGAMLKLEPWFDEGWALALARNWVVLDHYGHLFNGEPIPATILNMGFPIVSLYALSFKLFGVGLWQARLVSAGIVLGTVCLFYILAQRLYEKAVANIALIIAFFLPGLFKLHPVLNGSQVLGEMPTLACLFGGYLMLTHTLKKDRVWLAFPALLFALALQSKPQALPFLAVSFLAAMLYTWITHCKPVLYPLLICALLTISINQLLTWGWQGYAKQHNLATSMSSDPYAMVRDFNTLFIYVISLIPQVRLDVMRAVLFAKIGPLSMVGVVAYVFLRLKKRTLNFKESTDVIQMMVWVFATSWLGWYMCLSIGWPRYALPGVFVGSLYAADFAHYVYIQFREHLRMKGTVILIMVLGGIAFVYTTTGLYDFFRHENGSRSYYATLKYLNTQTAPDALIELYESELFFLLERPYHYPPDSVQHIYNRNSVFGMEHVVYDYDPLATQPDYIVTGEANALFRLYDDVLRSGQFSEVFTAGHYAVYKNDAIKDS